MHIALNVALWGDLLLLVAGFGAGAFVGYRFGARAVQVANKVAQDVAPVVQAGQQAVNAAKAITQDVKKA